MCLKNGKNNSDNNLLFPSPDGQPISNNAINKQLNRLLNEVVPDKMISFHGLRQTHASLLLSKDIDLKYVSERLGHTNYDITLNTYAHLLKKKRSDAISKSIKLLNNM